MQISWWNCSSVILKTFKISIHIFVIFILVILMASWLSDRWDFSIINTWIIKPGILAAPLIGSNWVFLIGQNSIHFLMLICLIYPLFNDLSIICRVRFGQHRCRIVAGSSRIYINFFMVQKHTFSRIIIGSKKRLYFLIIIYNSISQVFIWCRIVCVCFGAAVHLRLNICRMQSLFHIFASFYIS